MDTRKLTFAIMMGALGNVLCIISYLLQIIPGAVALDLSLLAVFIAGIYAGPKTGFITGLIAGIIPGIMFGPLGTGGILGLIALPIGKGLTGLTMGLLSITLHNKYSKIHKSLLIIPVTVIAYIPECIFTYAYFTVLLPLFLNSAPLASTIVTAILIKAVIEVIIMGFILSGLIYSKTVSNLIGAYFHKT
jgi:riboflavin transporter FmnP